MFWAALEAFCTVCSIIPVLYASPALFLFWLLLIWDKMCNVKLFLQAKAPGKQLCMNWAICFYLFFSFQCIYATVYVLHFMAAPLWSLCLTLSLQACLHPRLSVSVLLLIISPTCLCFSFPSCFPGRFREAPIKMFLFLSISDLRFLQPPALPILIIANSL